MQECEFGRHGFLSIRNDLHDVSGCSRIAKYASVREMSRGVYLPKAWAALNE